MDGARKELLLAYCRLDKADLSEAENLLLESFYEGSIYYMKEAGVAEPKEPGRKALFDLVINSMTLQAWDHRDMTEIAAAAENPEMRRIINQLKMSEPDDSDVSESDTGSEGSESA